MVDSFADEIAFVRMSGDQLVLRTDRDASRGRVVLASLDGEFVDLIPEGESTLQAVRGTAAGLATLTLVDAQPVLTLYALDGSDAAGHRRTGRGSGGVQRQPRVRRALRRPVDHNRPHGVVRRLDLRRAWSGRCRSWSAAQVDSRRPSVTVTRRVEPGREVPYFLITRSDLDFSHHVRRCSTGTAASASRSWPTTSRLAGLARGRRSAGDREPAGRR